MNLRLLHLIDNQNQIQWEGVLTPPHLQKVAAACREPGREVPFWEGAFYPIRTHTMSLLAQDLFLPTLCNHALKIDSVAIRIFAVLGAILFDGITLVIRFCTLAPRVLWNRNMGPEQHPLYTYLLQRGVDPSLLDQGRVRIGWIDEEKNKEIHDVPLTAVPEQSKGKEDYPSGVEETFAAIHSQRLIRGFIGRRFAKQEKEIHTLVMTPEELKKQPKAERGHIPVYFPLSIPGVVIKEANNPKMRMTKMTEMRQLCKDLKLSHMTVPSAHLHRHPESAHTHYLIEKRLPLPSVHWMSQIELYCENKDRFTDAVVEFTKIYCLTSFDDLVQSGGGIAILSEAATLRTDNAPLYIEKGVGKMGLIDLEHWFLEIKPDLTTFKHLYDLASFFPHHCKEIIAAAESIGYGILPETVRVKMGESAAKAIDGFNKIYFHYCSYLQKKGITLETATTTISLTEEQKDSLIEKMLEELPTYKYWFSSQSEWEQLLAEGCAEEPLKKLFKEVIFPTTLDLFLKECQALLKRQGDMSRPFSVKNGVDLASHRMRFVEQLCGNIFYRFNHGIVPIPFTEISSVPYSENIRGTLATIAKMSIPVVFQQLKEWGIIYDYRPTDSYGPIAFF